MISPNNTEVVIGDPDEHIYNTMIGYRCSEGHDLMFGDLSRTCQSSKTWSGEAPTCQGKSSLVVSYTFNAIVYVQLYLI